MQIGRSTCSINEAFAVVPMKFMKDELSDECERHGRRDRHGHPLGATAP